MNYLTYDEYQNYGGTLDKTAFEEYEFSASGTVNHYTYNRLVNDDTVPEAVKRVVYRLISLAEQQAAATSTSGAAVTSHSNDGVSESFAVMSPENIYQALSGQVKDVVLNGLSGVRNSKGHRLLYRGLYPDE